VAVLIAGAWLSPSVSASPCDRPATTIIVVRHAERAGKADSLSAAGVARARELARVLGFADVTAIYHSDTKRTRDTAWPLAAARGITPEEYPAKDAPALIERIFAAHEGGTVLVVGHSNTVPMIVSAAGGPALADLAEDAYDGLYVVTVAPCREGPARLVTLRFGAASP
jgi:broad specificity phosphatase PhoE